MSDQFSNVQGEFEAQKARIMIIGVGGGGNNTVSTLMSKGVEGAKIIAINTDAKHLQITKANEKILIGKNITKGLGAGGYPDIGKQAALESKNEIKKALEGVDLLFVTCGLGGGTGTGAAPVVSKIAKDAGAIVIAAVTMPFKLEGARMLKAEEGLAHLREACDTVIVIENQKLLQLGGKMPIKQAFGIADGLIALMIKGITEMIAVPSMVNLDFADVKAIMRSGGVATIGVGEAEGPKRAVDAITRALSHPLLDVDYTGATGALIQVIGGPDMKLDEIELIGEAVQQNMSQDAQVMWGARILPEFEHKIQVITIITGIKSAYIIGPTGAKMAKPKGPTGELGIDSI
ncbi:MAG: cell division protein FtsZ [Candidatus Aenigmarchaeota archaeon]|nr:cell division protein FtsZ [Candidatus Aenigmarchaeota archaeon]